MSRNRLLIGGLGAAAAIGAYFIFGREAKASTRDQTPEPLPPPPPTPPSRQPGRPPSAANCDELFNRWRNLSTEALSVCRTANELGDEVDMWQARFESGDPFYNESAHSSVYQEWLQVNAHCQSIHAASLQAMVEYEACMASLGLQP